MTAEVHRKWDLCGIVSLQHGGQMCVSHTITTARGIGGGPRLSPPQSSENHFTIETPTLIQPPTHSKVVQKTAVGGKNCVTWGSGGNSSSSVCVVLCEKGRSSHNNRRHRAVP
eukprot:gene7905-10123_t